MTPHAPSGDFGPSAGNNAGLRHLSHLLLAVVAIAMLAIPSSALAAHSTWGTQGPLPGMLHYPAAITVTPSGTLLLGDGPGGYGRIQEFSVDGTFIKTVANVGGTTPLAATTDGFWIVGTGGWLEKRSFNGSVLGGSSAGAADASSLAIAPNGDIYAAVPSACAIYRFDAAAPHNEISHWGSCGSGIGQFGSRSTNPFLGLAINSAGHVFVGDSANWRVSEFTASGTFVKNIGGPGVAPGMFNFSSPYYLSVAVDASDNVYAVDRCRVQKFNSSGAFVTLDQAPDNCGSWTALAIVGVDSAVVTNYDGNNTVTRITPPWGQWNTGGDVGGGGGGSGSTSCTAPPSGPIGVSILDGAPYTNDPEVTIDTVWPRCTGTLTISNDGGFKKARQFPMAASIDWTLASSGPERLPKTIYVRFGNSSQTYTDDIILDETDPTLSSVTVTTSTTRIGHPNGRAKAGVSVTTIASDKTSGLGRIQITSTKKKPGPLIKYAKTVRASVSGSVVWVRVQDKAGNFSAWKRAGA